MTVTSTEPVISVHGLTKRYGDLQAVAGIDFEVGRGEVFGLLGPNGAGKTTTVEILEGLRVPDGGEVRVLGHDVRHDADALKPRIGVSLQTASMYPKLTVAELIDLFASFYPRARPTSELIEALELGERRDAQSQVLSGGQRQRLAVALALVNDPELVFLDEPTTGLDPAARRSLWDLVGGLKAEGRSVLLTTHYMEEAQRLADRVAVLAGGRLIAIAAPEELGGEDSTLVTFRLPEGVDASDLPIAVDGPGPEVTLRTTTPTRDLAPLLSWAAVRGYELEGLTVSRPSLEDVYLELTA